MVNGNLMNDNASMASDSRPKSLTLLIVDDHDLVRETVGLCLQRQEDVVVSMANSLPVAEEMVEAAGSFDVILLDVQMPGGCDLNDVERLVTRNAPGAISLFSGATTRRFVLDAMARGARGFIPKTLPLRSLVSAIRLIASGETFAPMSFLVPDDEEQPGNGVMLTVREREALRLVCDGLANKEIARRMNVSETTVKMHMRSTCAKLGARNRTHAAMIAREGELC